MNEPPALTSSSVLLISREGGLAHFPGLAKPRRIVCADCSDLQRQALQRLLQEAVRRCAAEKSSAGADRHVFRLQIGEEGKAPCWTLEIIEEQAPHDLIMLWKRGEIGFSR
ncbi:hypothetical protein L861_12065 [Litchfieldella anticariensis FP35 = DSM 16096]|uniref:Uncharacterized protein n=1 Tax=Litchfieldella anticariensis (strain DSM 16096 / CECT 5854 / CIP 108499 / LMG 22089 / FP35) TaxID=1121939 RepID=S2KGR6_LITA3|nr:protealysin inhibitor emfourin [Halomonas anticariensis]EPC01302.1 hypothetical protein L861_12065 [Halomonas anticariensis FP35 = DSM 16096]